MKYWLLSLPDRSLGTASLQCGDELSSPLPSGSRVSGNSSHGNCIGDVPHVTPTHIALAF
jgi:hypothetical protein